MTKRLIVAGVSAFALTFAADAALAGGGGGGSSNDTSFDDTDAITASVLNANVSGTVNFEPGFGSDQSGNAIGQGAFSGASGAVNVVQNTGHGSSVQSANTMSVLTVVNTGGPQ